MLIVPCRPIGMRQNIVFIGDDDDDDGGGGGDDDDDDDDDDGGGDDDDDDDGVDVDVDDDFILIKRYIKLCS